MAQAHLQLMVALAALAALAEKVPLVPIIYTPEAVEEAVATEVAAEVAQQLCMVIPAAEVAAADTKNTRLSL